MYKVFVGGISPEGEHLLTTYLNVFMPDAVIEPLKAVGIKGRMKNHAKRQDVALVIMDEVLYQTCVGVVDDVLALPKVHKYTDDDSLNQFLISKFGRLDGVSVTETAVIPPDMLMGEESESDSYIENNDDIYTSPYNKTTPPDQLMVGVNGVLNSVQEDEFDNLAVQSDSFTQDEQNDALIQELQDKLSRSELLVHNLTLQLEDKTSGSDDDISAFIARIRELEEEVNSLKQKSELSEEDNYINLGKIARAEQIIGEFDNLKIQLKKANEDKSALEYDKTTLSGQVELLGSQIDDFKTKLAEFDLLKTEVAEKNDKISELTISLNEKLDAYDEKVIELEGLKAELGVVQTELTSEKEKTSQIESISAELKAREIEVDNLTDELRALRQDLANANSEIESLKVSLTENSDKLSEKEQEISYALSLNESNDAKLAELNNKISELESEVNNLNSTISSNESIIEDLKLTIANNEDTIETYRANEEQLNSEIEALRLDCENSSSKDEEIKGYLESLKEKDDYISTLRSELEEKSDCISNLQEEKLLIEEDIEVKSKAIDSAINERNELEDRLVTCETEKLDLEKEVSSLNNKLSDCKETIDKLDKDLSSTVSEKEKLESDLLVLQEDLNRSTVAADNVVRLENDLLEERKKSARLTSEVEVLKKTSDSGKSSELRLEIAKLNNELSELRNSSANVSEFEKLKADLAFEKEKRVSLELDLADKDEQITELSENIFAQMLNVAMPKVPYDINLPVPVGVDQRFYCVCSGSDESSAAVYKALRKTCASNSNKRILIVDLVTDSSIDREFGIPKVVSPVDWLIGSKPFRDFIASTNFQNVRVLSTALAFLNDLFLLQVNWQKRLQDLSAFSADIIIINIGCLNNIVTKVLFNMFSHCMRTYIITKATPVNLRTVILNMTGIKDVSENVSIECVDFDNKASKAMYERLASKYKAHILQASEVLEL